MAARPASRSRVVILRHAQSEWNALGRWQGQADPPLSAEGRRQAFVAADHLARARWFEAFDLVVSSDLLRALQTAELLVQRLGLGTPPRPDEGLREFDAGEWSGLTLDEIEQRWPGEVERFTHGLVDSPPGGESRRSFDRRIAEAMARIGHCSERAEARSVLVVAHGGVVGSVARSAGVSRRHIGHLAGYVGMLDKRGLSLDDPLDLLSVDLLAVDLLEATEFAAGSA